MTVTAESPREPHRPVDFETAEEMREQAERYKVGDAFKRWRLAENRMSLSNDDFKNAARAFIMSKIGDIPVTDSRLYAPDQVRSIGDSQVDTKTTVRGLLAAIDGDLTSYEFGRLTEDSREIEKRMGRKASGLFIRPSALRATTLSNDVPALIPYVQRPDLLVGAPTPATVLQELGVRDELLTYDSYFPAFTNTALGNWHGENEQADPYDPATRSIPLVLHQHSMHTTFSRKVWKQGLPHPESLMREMFVRRPRIAIEAAAIGNLGGNAPTGLLGITGIPTYELGENGGTLDWNDIHALVAEVASSDILFDAPGFLSNFEVRRLLMTRPRVTGHPIFLVNDTTPDTLAGYKIRYTSNVPRNLTKGTGTGLSMLAFGNWRDMVIAQFDAVDLIIDPYSESKKGNVTITAHSGWDVAVRHPESFVVVRDVITTQSVLPPV